MNGDTYICYLCGTEIHSHYEYVEHAFTVHGCKARIGPEQPLPRKKIKVALELERLEAKDRAA